LNFDFVNLAKNIFVDVDRLGGCEKSSLTKSKIEVDSRVVKLDRIETSIFYKEKNRMDKAFAKKKLSNLTCDMLYRILSTPVQLYTGTKCAFNLILKVYTPFHYLELYSIFPTRCSLQGAPVEDVDRDTLIAGTINDPLASGIAVVITGCIDIAPRNTTSLPSEDSAAVKCSIAR
jgi:hypothetical protein